jgi:ADP-dependent NAD(P)H-hydrate dehydratase / NAD(P)H-hydrate epimerase
VTVQPILTAAEMRAAEAAVVQAGTGESALMERAGAGAAAAIRRFIGLRPTLVLCGPGNNGGDGYVIARLLQEAGAEVRVAALAPPRSGAAREAAGRWQGPVERVGDGAPAAVLVDALFGTGLVRKLDEELVERLAWLAAAAEHRVAVDLPSGVSTDDGAILSPVPAFDLTITFGSLKPAHLLQPAAAQMGKLHVVDIGVEASSALRLIGRPRIASPGPGDHKYTRGYVAVVAGEMPGAAALTASAALRGGAGYVALDAAVNLSGVPRAIVQRAGGWLQDRRIGAIAIGPGLGRGEEGRRHVEEALASERPLVLDADALVHIAGLGLERIAGRDTILTPHEGEFEKLFGIIGGSKVERARAAAVRADAVVVLKGTDTVIAAPDGRAAIASPASPWLASAGTGDVLTGIIAATRAAGRGAFDAACEGVWLHGQAARIAGAGLIADDLVEALPAALALCR